MTIEQMVTSDSIQIAPEDTDGPDLLDEQTESLAERLVFGPTAEELQHEETLLQATELPKPHTATKKRTYRSGYSDNTDSTDVIGLYMRDISDIPVLTAQEEFDAFTRYHKGIQAQKTLQRGHGSKQTERIKIIEDGHAARQTLITANTRWVITLAHQAIEKGVDFDDLIQEGNVGLIRAIAKFDQHKGNRFTTYATWWIRHHVQKAVYEQRRPIRLSIGYQEKLKEITRAREALEQQLGAYPSLEAIAEHIRIPVKTLNTLVSISRMPLSLDVPIHTSDDPQSDLGDYISEDYLIGQSPDLPESAVIYQHRAELITTTLDRLPFRLRRILQLRSGLWDGNAYTLEEVGEILGVTRERVRQLEAQAIAKIDKESKRRLTSYASGAYYSATYVDIP